MSQQPEFPAKTTRPVLPWGWRSLWQHSTRTGLAALALSGSFPTASILHAQSLPTGEQTIQGSATYTPTSNSLTINTPGRAVISWGSFNIGNGNVVDFQNGGAVLNYVRQGGGASQINGMLRATNPIILLNNQGISVGRTGMISVPSILLSTGSLLPDSIDKFMQGVNYAPGLNAPLISIQLNDSSGPISVDGSISSTNGGGIGLIAPSLSIGPNARLTSLGVRTASTGTDGVNTTVNGVVPEGSLWIGTTGLPASSFTQPIPGMPGAALPTLPTGFGFTQVSGRPSPQNIRLSLQATYDFERVVIGTSGARRGQFDALFFSPTFRAAAFYLYDGIEAIEEGHRQATTGGLRRTLKDTQTNQLIDDQLESDILGLQLPAGATLLAADQVVLDPNGQLIGGNLTIGSNQSLSQPFLDQFGTGAFTVSISGGQGTLTGSNGAQASYNPTTGAVSWQRTIQGPPTTQTLLVPGTAISQGHSFPPSVLEGAGTSGSYTEKEGGYYHGRGGGYAGQSPCPGCRYFDPVTGSVTYWRGHFASDGPTGQPRFVQDQTGGTVVYKVGGQYYTTQASSFFNSQGSINKPSIPAGTTFTPQVVQTVVRPGATTVVPFQETLPIRGQAKPPSGAAESSWVRPTPPVQPDLTPTPKVSPTPTPLPYNIPTPSVAPPSPGPTPAPTPTTAVVSPANAPSWSGSNPAVTPSKGPDISGYAPYVVPNPTPAPQPTLAPSPTVAVVKPNISPTISGYAPGPQIGKGPDVTGNAPYVVPNPTPAPQPTLAPSPTVAVVKPNVSPTISGYAPGPQVGKGPDVTGNAPYVVPNPTPAPQPTLAPSPTVAVVKPNISPTISGYAPGPQVGKGPDVTGNAPYVVPNPTPSPRPIPVPTPTTTVVFPNVSPTISGYAPGPQVGKGPDVTGNAPYVVPNPTPSPRPIPVPTPTTTVVTPIVSPPITGYGPVNPTVNPTGAVPKPRPVPTPTTTVVTPIVSPPITGYGPVNPTVNPTGAVPKPRPVPTPTTTVVTPIVSPPITGYGPVNPTVNPTGAVPKPRPVPTPTTTVVTPIVSPPITGYGPVNPSVNPTGAVPKPRPVPTPTTTVVTPIVSPPITGYGPVNPTVNPTGAVPKPNPVPTPTTTVVTPIVSPPITGYGPVNPTVNPTGAVPKPNPVPTPTAMPPVAGPDGSRAVLQPAVSRAVTSIATSGNRSERRGLAVTYEVPRALIEANVKGGLPDQSRATLPNGSQLPAALEYDPSSQTFTVKDTNLLPLPLDVLLTMPTVSGGRGTFILTIGQP